MINVICMANESINGDTKYCRFNSNEYYFCPSNVFINLIYIIYIKYSIKI